MFRGRQSVRLCFVDEIRGSNFSPFSSGSWPAQKTKFRDGSVGRCVLWGARQSARNWPANFSWSSLQAVKLCSLSAKSVVLLIVNEQNQTFFVIVSW